LASVVEDERNRRQLLAMSADLDAQAAKLEAVQQDNEPKAPELRA